MKVSHRWDGGECSGGSAAASRPLATQQITPVALVHSGHNGRRVMDASIKGLQPFSSFLGPTAAPDTVSNGENEKNDWPEDLKTPLRTTSTPSCCDVVNILAPTSIFSAPSLSPGPLACLVTLWRWQLLSTSGLRLQSSNGFLADRRHHHEAEILNAPTLHFGH